MDPIIQELLKEGGKTVLATALTACLTKLLRSRKGKITTQDAEHIEKTADRMIQAATMDDVRLYSPAYHSVSRAVSKKSAAYKKAAPKKVHVLKNLRVPNSSALGSLGLGNLHGQS